MGDEGRGYSGNDWQGWAAEARTRRTDKTARNVQECRLKKCERWRGEGGGGGELVCKCIFPWWQVLCAPTVWTRLMPKASSASSLRYMYIKSQ